MLYFFNKVDKALSKTENIMLIILMIVMTVSCCFQVLNRNIFKLPGFSFFEELACFSMVYLGLVAGAVGIKEGTQVSISIVTDHLPKGARLALEYIGGLIIFAFGIFMFIASIPLMQNLLFSGQKSPSMQIPMIIPYFAVVLCFILVSVAMLDRLALKTLALQQERKRGIE